jgi:hypothetical protein
MENRMSHFIAPDGIEEEEEPEDDDEELFGGLVKSES